jgi:hypothetical protein
MGEQPPGVAGPEPVGDGVNQLAVVMEGRAATGLGRRNEREKRLPLGVGQVGAYGRRDKGTGGFLIAIGIGTAADHTGSSDTL